MLRNTGLSDWSWWNLSVQFWGDTSCSRDPDFQLGLKLLLQLSGQVILVPTGVYWCILERPAGADGNHMRRDWTVLKEERGSKESSDRTTLQSSLFSSSSLLFLFCPWVHATSSTDRKWPIKAGSFIPALQKHKRCFTHLRRFPRPQDNKN